jgi:uncharacterized protein (DUF488 family)
MNSLFSIGHSHHSLSAFFDLIRAKNITAVADVRVRPYSRFSPQFNREDFQIAMKSQKIPYVYLGDQLGARPEFSFEKRIETQPFKAGIGRILKGAKTERIALMCAEKDCATCHRSLLIGRHFKQLDIEIQHIGAEGEIETHSQAMSRLIDRMKLPQQDLFRSHQDILNEVYQRQADLTEPES